MLLAFAPAALAQEGLELTTDYPAVAVAPGSNVTFTLQVHNDRTGRVDLEVSGAPDDWSATLQGGGRVVDAVFVTAGEPTEVDLDLTVPDGASGTTNVTVRASDGSRTAELALDVRISETAAGEVTLETDVPGLQGTADDSFRFSLTFRNDTPEDLTVGVAAQGPPGWNVQARLTTQSQAASAIVESGSSTSVEVTAEPPATVGAQTYQIVVQATAGSYQVQRELAVQVTGRYEANLTTPDQRFNASGSAGSAIEQSLVVENTGTAPLENVSLAHTAPTGWEVTFEPATIESIPANDTAEVTARITPSGDAIAGDYVVTLRASNDEVNVSREIRVTVETSLLWGVIGVALIVAVLAGLAWVFRTYGRR